MSPVRAGQKRAPLPTCAVVESASHVTSLEAWLQGSNRSGLEQKALHTEDGEIGFTMLGFDYTPRRNDLSTASVVRGGAPLDVVLNSMVVTFAVWQPEMEAVVVEKE